MPAIAVDPDTGALRGTPPDRRAFTYPLVPLATLSEDARILYRRAGQRLDRDLFAKDWRYKYVSHEEKKSFQPTPRMLDAIAELERAGYATYDTTYGNLFLTRTAPEYSYALGRGGNLITVEAFDSHPMIDNRLLAVLIGGDLETLDSSSGAMTNVRLRTRHDSAVDFEHDSSDTAYLTVANPSLPVFRGLGHFSFVGVLTESRMYPLGTNPDEQSDGDTENRAPALCARCNQVHPFLPGSPPADETPAQPRLVTVQVRPFRAELVHDPSRPAPTHRDAPAEGEGAP
ncbi:MULTISPECIES: hypothetical protein [unclassified Microbacterium]|uniref:hypothetical protein n=1 Tax=unclassified Microbacterium TaxID=2609290 RepID=UPI0028834D8C|nr:MULTISPECIES: hypothetical protein [unclassified Microbacterium]